ncbi:MAG TPA: hypothetical protein PKZ47_05520 [Alistipes sp.]|uniref:hypothetical protein n=1 Tax=unclassified Alistipes TaxID=2608932 RepID=UPI00258EC171|nr:MULTISPECIES: hypothetical protein [unclassified Alistipes]HUN14469.1 hypothetical protein [Alistipes sp.]
MDNCQYKFLMIIVPFVASIMGLAFPLFLQVVNRIDEKYSSTRLVSEFQSEKGAKWFKWLLIIAIVICFTTGIAVIITTNMKGLNVASIVISGAATAAIIVSLFRYYSLISIYSVPLKLFQRLDKKYSKQLDYKLRSTDNVKCKYRRKVIEKKNVSIQNRVKDIFDTIAELLYYSIRQQDETLQKELYTFIASYMFRKQSENKNAEVVYDDYFYGMLYESTELICTLPQKIVSYSNGNTLLIQFFDVFNGSLLSEKSYNSMWRTLRQQLNYGKEDHIVNYWTFAHQYPQVYLQDIYPDYYYDQKLEKIVIKNAEVVNKREKARARFFEFHYALGALILYLQKYSLLNNLIRYTNTQPPQYILVPSSISEIFKRSIEYSNNIFDIVHFESRYPFPGLSGVNQNGVIIKYIRKYLAVLFLRQYLIGDYLGKRHWSIPDSPTSLGEINKWEEVLIELNTEIDSLLKDTELLDSLELPMSEPEWFEKNNFEHPDVLIKRMIDSLYQKYHKIKKEQPIDLGKKEDFIEKTRNIITETIENLMSLFIAGEKDDSSISFPLRLNNYQVMEKTAFAAEQDMGYINHDSVVAQGVASNYKYQTSYTFNRFIKKRLLLSQKDVFAAINKLNLDASKHIIICFGIDINYYIEILGNYAITKCNGEYKFKTIDIINVKFNLMGIDPETILIIEKNSLPSIEFKKSDTEYELPEIDDQYHLKADIINLSGQTEKERQIRKCVEENMSPTKIDESVLVCIELEPIIKWNKNTKIVAIKVYHQFQDSILPDTVDNIRSFDEYIDSAN